ncbi:MAG: peptide deformylase [Nitrospirae bacterium]|nr:peptide deformylase [Nitrospirota bacterium]MBI4838182.1 peptide deformylase [Nitrospirota bacterium]
MAVLEIKTYPDKILKEKTAPVTEFDEALQKLIDDMIETMYSAFGVGLAANQVGEPKRVLVIDVSSKEAAIPLIVLINPEIVSMEGAMENEEGCLSLPGYTTVVKRAEKVKVAGLDRKGAPIEIEGGGLLSRALQHEIDHLNGKLLIDRIGRIKRELFKRRHKKAAAAGK